MVSFWWIVLIDDRRSKMMRLVIIALFYLVMTKHSHGLNCMKCTNARTQSECDRVGMIERCSSRYSMCKTVIRSISTSGRQLITKGCKQAGACRNNMNVRSCRDGPPPPNAVCYCCCSSDQCNRGASSCRGNRGTVPPSEGTRKAISSIFCNPPQRSPKYGRVDCSDTHRIGSRCYFRCLTGYVISEGAPSAKCRRNGLWSGIAPTCTPVACSVSYSDIKSGRASCSRKNYVTSKCRFKCNRGYVIKGKSSSVCSLDRKNLTRGKWTNQLPRCIKLPTQPRCGRLQSPDNGSVKCRRKNKLGSVCKFGCRDGYHLRGTQTTTCSETDAGKLDWTHSLPLCEATIKCPKIPKDSYRMVKCSDGSQQGSVCTFLCRPTHNLIGPSRVTCLQRNDKSAWEPELPVCVAKTCSDLGDFPNGLMTCGAGNEVNSRCVFSCLENYHLIGRDEVTCNQLDENHVVWDNALPSCEPLCEAITLLDNGRIECLEGRRVGSSCSFDCDDDFKLSGAYVTTCIEAERGTKWSHKPPECKSICAEIKEFRNGEMICSDSNFLGSSCLFTCRHGYQLVGTTNSSCINAQGGGTVWERGIPQCREYCSRLSDIVDGVAQCSDANLEGSVCNFSCRPGFGLQGSRSTSCGYNEADQITWSKEVPRCERLHCPELPVVEHGAWECSSGFEYDSVCNFSCQPSYDPLPSMSSSITCLADQSWSRSPPCCATPCSKNPYMDLLFALDSSSSLGEESWRLMVEFVQTVTSFYDADANGTRIGAFRYNRKIDFNNSIPFNFAKARGKQALIDEIGKLPYDGKGTKIGQALNYAASEMFHPKNGDRKGAQDVLIVLTDGASQDRVEKYTDILRNHGVLIFAVAVTSATGNLNHDQLRYISGHDHNLFVLGGGFASLTKDFARDLTQSVCKDPCYD